MSKKTIVDALLDAAEVRVREAGVLADALLDALKHEIKVKGSLRLPGIGTLSVVRRARREGSNPKTGKPYVTPERKAVRFKASPALTSELNGAREK